MEEGLLFQALDDWECVDHLVKDNAGGGAVPHSQAYSPHSDDTNPLMEMPGKAISLLTSFIWKLKNMFVKAKNPLMDIFGIADFVFLYFCLFVSQIWTWPNYD